MNRHRKIKRFFRDYVNQIYPMMIELLEDELQKSTEKSGEVTRSNKYNACKRFTRSIPVLDRAT